MKNITISTIAGVFLLAALGTSDARACTNFLISKKASTDGSTMISYSADSHSMYGELYYTPAALHLPGEKLEVYEWDSGKFLGVIDQIPQTYSVVGNINERQVAIGETTWGGRKELKEHIHPDAIVDYGSLMYITLQRAKTAREAIKIMTGLVEKYGYASSGESFSISGPDEVWIMDMIGKGEKDKGAVWVARRIPDGYVSAHANQARIRKFPLNNKNTLYARDVISFARDMGWFDGADADFSFMDAYSPMSFRKLRICEARVWAFFKRIAPSKNFSSNYVKGKKGARPLPLWITPDKKLSARDVMELMRDHFEGTDLDLTKGVGAGPYSLPYRWRPLFWEHEGEEYFNERATSTQQTGFSFITQSRSWLPDPIGGILWFGVDDTYSTVYVPMYCGIKEAPEPFAVGNGDFHHFTWDSAFWVFNFVANFAYLRYSDMIVDIQKVQRELEGGFFSDIPRVDRTAVSMFKKAPDAARNYLTRYSRKQSEKTLARWRKLGEFLLYKYLDGNVKDTNGKAAHPPYPEHWRKRIVKERGGFYKAIKLPGEPEDDH